MKKQSTVKRGNYFKQKTKKWLERQGYQVGFLERMFMLFIGGKTIPIKRDQFGSDLLAVSKDNIIFVQVKFIGGQQKNNGIPKAKKEFEKFVFPEFSKRWIVVWELRKREPEIISC